MFWNSNAFIIGCQNAAEAANGKKDRTRVDARAVCPYCRRERRRGVMSRKRRMRIIGIQIMQ